MGEDVPGLVGSWRRRATPWAKERNDEDGKKEKGEGGGEGRGALESLSGARS